MRSHQITMLGTGLIGDFYTAPLHSQRSRDRVRVVYSRSEERGKAFSQRWDIPEHTTSITEAVEHPETDVVVVGLPNFLHEEAIGAPARPRQGRSNAHQAHGNRAGSRTCEFKAGVRCSPFGSATSQAPSRP